MYSYSSNSASNSGSNSNGSAYWGIPGLSSSSSTPSASTAMQELRRKQIASLRDHSLSVREVQRDTTFEVSCSIPSTPTVAGYTLCLVVTLPPQFPDNQQPPTIQVRPPPVVAHAWIDARTGLIVGHDKLSNWNQHVSLGKLVKEIIQEFQIRHPAIVSSPADPTRMGPFAAPLSSSSNNASTASHAQNPTYHSPPPPHPHQQPVQTTHYATLDTMTAAELEVLVSDEAALQQFVDGLPHMREARALERNLRAENESLAKKNLSRQIELQEKRNALLEKYQELQKRRQEFDDLMAKQQDELFRFTPEYLTMQLREAASESESLSDSMAEAFREGRIPVEDFLRQYRETRKVYHMRAAKLERVVKQAGVFQ
ncbi:hypothetical protein SeMB42_g07957 [Synchytrium endobioticum]|uniref:VPS37 C-terminal domain-containing protein n=1 Tax=Synchytrium endobioticum TaxID=286115 RepID=A0A507BRQ4_9FUNG|nr:hypothetical protein SeMB42_g07957 [Synchytrium endobioticum]TPX45741.1 hypothetical protein SeLEV6574_g03701 [Synchytrium endobioticum]